MLQKLREYSKYLLLFLFGALLLAFVLDSQKTLALLRSIFAGVGFLTTRFVMGFGIAYGLNFLVSFLRRRFRFGKIPAIALTYLVFFGFIAVLLVFIVPMVTESVGQIVALIGSVPKYYNQAQAWLESVFVDLDEEIVEKILEFGQIALQNLLSLLNGLMDFDVWENILRDSTRFLMNLLFAMVISVYVLNEQEDLAKGAKRLVYALFPTRRAHDVVDFVRESNRVFSQFLVGKILDSLIIGILSAIAYTLLRIPQGGFFAILAGVTNMIPYFGPLVGGVLTVFILLFYNIPAALAALGTVIVLQCLDGWFLGPKILGNAVGISPLLTIVAITAGGDLFGFTGIFLGVPAMAVLKTMVYERYISGKLVKRRQEAIENGSKTGAEDSAIYHTLEEQHRKDLESKQEKKPQKRKPHKKRKK